MLYKTIPTINKNILIRAGSFIMGKTNRKYNYYPEKPEHEVEITYNYLVDNHLITYDEYDRFCDETGRKKPEDSGFGRKQKPVVNVSWLDAVRYCNWKSRKENIKAAYDDNGNLLNEYGAITQNITTVNGWRLLTEAEWEYAARGGHKNKQETEFSGSDEVNNVANIENQLTSIVGSYRANELGIYDMCGNVYEWCQDYYDQNYYQLREKTNPVNLKKEKYRVIRGGCWKSSCIEARISSRNWEKGNEKTKKNIIGFRIARLISSSEPLEHSINLQKPFNKNNDSIVKKQKERKNKQTESLNSSTVNIENEVISSRTNEILIEEEQILIPLPPIEEKGDILIERIKKYEAVGFVIKRKKQNMAVLIKPKSFTLKIVLTISFLLVFIFLIYGLMVNIDSGDIYYLFKILDFLGLYIFVLGSTIFFSTPKVKISINSFKKIVETGITLEKIEKAEKRKVRIKKKLPYLVGFFGVCLLIHFILSFFI